MYTWISSLVVSTGKNLVGSSTRVDLIYVDYLVDVPVKGLDKLIGKNQLIHSEIY